MCVWEAVPRSGGMYSNHEGRSEEWGVDPGRAAGVQGTGQVRSPHVAVAQQMLETWTLPCNVSADSSGHREDQVRSRVWKHAAQCLVRAQWALSSSVLISVTRGYRRGISSLHVGRLQQESQVHTLKEMDTPACGQDAEADPWPEGWPRAGPPASRDSAHSHVFHTVMAGLPWEPASPTRLSCVRGVYHGVACFRFVVCTVSNCGGEHPAARPI